MLFYSYYFNIFRKNFISKIHLKNIMKIPKISYILINVIYRTTKSSNKNYNKSYKLLYLLQFLENFAGQKPFVKKYICFTSNKYFQDSDNSKIKDTLFLAQVTLRKKNLYRFLDYFYLCIISYLYIRKIKYKSNFNYFNKELMGFYIILEQLTNLPFLLRKFILIDFKLIINFYFTYPIKSLFELNNISLHLFNIIKKKKNI